MSSPRPPRLPGLTWSADRGAEVALVEFFTDRDNRDEHSAALKGGA